MTAPIRLLVTAAYSTDGLPLGPGTVKNPTWQQIEQSIRQLDQFCHPLVRLCRTDDDDADDYSLNILGGNGKYALFSLCSDWMYYDPAKGNNEIKVWLSDQGYSCCEQDVCDDVERAVRIARRFFETGSYETLDEVP